MEPEAAQQALAKIGALYHIEKQIKEKKFSADELLAYRQKHSEPVVNDFFVWVYEQRQDVERLPSNPLSKALKYVATEKRN